MASENIAGRVHNMDDEERLSGRNMVQPIFSSTSMQEAFRLEDQMVDAEKQQIINSPTLSERLGLDEFLRLNIWRASVGEVLGTAILVFMLDAIVISTYKARLKMPNLIMSILIAFVVAILLLATYPVSGGHLNPIISFSAGLVGVVSISRAIIYIVAQCIGAVLGALALKAVVSSDIQRNFSLGGCTTTIITPSPEGPIIIGLGTAQAFWMEVICSFVFLFASIWMAYDHRQAKSLGHVRIFSIIGIVVGLLVFISTTITTKKGYAGAGINPARCLGAAIVRGGHLWNDHWIFWAGPGVACVLFYLYTKIIPRQHFQSEGYYKHDFLGVVKVSFGSIVQLLKGTRNKIT